MNFTFGVNSKMMKNYYCLDDNDMSYVCYFVLCQICFNIWFMGKSYRMINVLNRSNELLHNIIGNISRLDCTYEGLNIHFNNIQDDLNVLLDRKESEYEPSENESEENDSNTETEKEITTDPPSEDPSTDSSTESYTSDESDDDEYVPENTEIYSDGCRKRKRIK